jgi:GTP 3',8-cyclase
MAEAKLAELEAEARERWPVENVAIIHRLGRLELGDISVAVAVSSPHRRQAFEAGQFLIDELKVRVPIWKKENWSDGTTEWVHPGLEESTGGPRSKVQGPRSDAAEAGPSLAEMSDVSGESVHPTPAKPKHIPPQLIDSFGRAHTNFRISVTDRCNIRCFYCMPAEDVEFVDKHELLSFEEIERVVKVAVSLGVNKIRLTGGEPLVRRDLPILVSKIAAIPEIKDIGLTTNGILLAEQAQALYDAGLRRLNVSLDALSAAKFKQITRRDGFEKVLAGITEAQRVGFDPVKINAVSVRGLTEEEIVPFGHFARETGVDLRFIEYMPLDADAAWQRERVLFAHEIIETLAREIMPLVPINQDDRSAPASEFTFSDGVGRIGFIASVSQPFCSNCNRFRITADGKLRNCLFSLEETDVRGILRGGGTDEQVATAMRESIAAKKEGHEINTARFIQPARPMYSIGG